jgi:hypothetical protein
MFATIAQQNKIQQPKFVSGNTAAVASTSSKNNVRTPAGKSGRSFTTLLLRALASVAV